MTRSEYKQRKAFEKDYKFIKTSDDAQRVFEWLSKSFDEDMREIDFSQSIHDDRRFFELIMESGDILNRMYYIRDLHDKYKARETIKECLKAIVNLLK